MTARSLETIKHLISYLMDDVLDDPTESPSDLKELWEDLRILCNEAGLELKTIIANLVDTHSSTEFEVQRLEQILGEKIVP